MTNSRNSDYIVRYAEWKSWRLSFDRQSKIRVRENEESGGQRIFSLEYSDIIQSHQSITFSWNWEMYIGYGTQWTVIYHCLPLISLLALFSHVSIALLANFIHHKKIFYYLWPKGEKKLMQTLAFDSVFSH